MPEGSRVYEFGAFRLDAPRHLLSRAGVEVPLPPKLFHLLVILVEAQGQTVDKDHLLATVWPDAVVEDGSLTRSISRLRTALGEQAGDEGLIRTVSRRGYRFVAPVREVQSPDPPAPADGPLASDVVPADVPAAGRADPFGWRPVAAAAVAVALVALLAWVGLMSRRGAPQTRPPSLAVLPFVSLENDPSDIALGLGLADSLITRFAGQSGVQVRPTSAIQRFAGAPTDSVSAGRLLSVDAVLEGTVRRVGAQHRVSARLVDGRSGAQLWGQTFDESSSSLLEVEDRLAKRVGEALSVALGSASRAARSPTTNPEAYEAYLRGRFLSFRLTKESFAESQKYLARALTLDPGMARAHEAIAYYHINTVDLVAPPRVAYPAAKEAVGRALALDPTLADAHASLALIEWQFDWNWPGAEREFRRAVELAPESAFVRSQYGFFLAAMGRVDESLAESERARALDPLSADVGITNATTFYWARRYAETAERIARVRSIDPNHWLAALISGRALEGQGARDQALAIYERAAALDGAIPEALMDLGRAYAASGRREDARRVLEDLRAFGRRQYAAPFHLAVIHAALGERDAAFDQLEQAVAARSWYVTWLKVDPSLDPLRSDARFPGLLARVGFGGR